VHREAGIVKWEKRARGRERVGEGTIFLIVPKRFKYNFNRISNCFFNFYKYQGNAPRV